MLRMGRRIRRTRRGDYEVSLPAGERELLRSLPGQLLEVLEAGPGDGDLRRLFPPAYARAEDERSEREYRNLMGGDLMDSHKQALQVMAATLDETRLDQNQMSAWLNAINELRLVIGTRLDVSEEQRAPEAGDPDAAGFALYGYLTWLQQQVIEALAGSL